MQTHDPLHQTSLNTWYIVSFKTNPRSALLATVAYEPRDSPCDYYTTTNVGAIKSYGKEHKFTQALFFPSPRAPERKEKERILEWLGFASVYNTDKEHQANYILWSGERKHSKLSQASRK